MLIVQPRSAVVVATNQVLDGVHRLGETLRVEVPTALPNTPPLTMTGQAS